MNAPLGRIDRRRFLRLLAASGALTWSGCRSPDPSPGSVTGGDDGSPAPTVRPAATGGSTAAAPTTTPAPTTAVATAGGDRVLVLVQLNGGNDGLNTVVPLDPRYRDARPTLGVPEAELVGLTGVADHALHDALTPLVPWWDAGQLALVPGVGFAAPDRSHFVSMDRWWHADGPAASGGWLGRVLDALPADDPLTAVALGGGAPVLRGVARAPVEVTDADRFGFDPALDLDALERLTAPLSDDELVAFVQRSIGAGLGAVEAFAAVAGPDVIAAEEPVAEREGGASIAAGLRTAARLVTGGGTRLVVVSAGGFDTHAAQLPAHRALLGDLAVGLAEFLGAIEAAGASDRVLVAGVSEFGRRVAENGSGGSDHGAGGLSFLAGAGVLGGVHGRVDLGDLLDGDVRPVVDPRTVMTACLEWFGADAEQVLGRRYDEIRLLR